MKILVPPSAKARQERWNQEQQTLGQAVRANQFAVREQGQPFNQDTMEERLVQCIWHDQLLDLDNLKTASGKTLRIIEPGRWNTGRGPDFQQARLMIAGREVFGDVEIHLTTKDWERHKHEADFEYNNVVLHACFAASDDRPYDQKQNGERLERLILEPVLQPDLETIARTINPDDYPFDAPKDTGLCHQTLAQLPQKKLQDFLLAAGKSRVEDKVERFRLQAASSSLPQVFYQALMAGMGYKSNKTCYFLLSKRVPLEEILDFARDLSGESAKAQLALSLLLATANLLPTLESLETPDDETQRFHETLSAHWSAYRMYFADRLMPPTKRWFAGMRPQGFPARRLAAVGILLCRLMAGGNDPFAPLEAHLTTAPEGGTPKEWAAFFKAFDSLLVVSEPDHYFARHYSLGGKAVKPEALLGQPAARGLLFNVVLPLLILKARAEKNTGLESLCWSALNVFPTLGENAVTKMMTRRLFAESGLEKSFCKNELKQQALYKIFQDCCSWNERTCDNCTFFQSPLSTGTRDQADDEVRLRLLGLQKPEIS